MGAGSTNSSPDPQDLTPLSVYSRFPSCSTGPVCVAGRTQGKRLPCTHPTLSSCSKSNLLPFSARKGQSKSQTASRRRVGALPALPLPAGGAARPRPCPSGAERGRRLAGASSERSWESAAVSQAAPAQPEAVPRPGQTGLTTPPELPRGPARHHAASDAVFENTQRLRARSLSRVLRARRTSLIDEQRRQGLIQNHQPVGKDLYHFSILCAKPARVRFRFTCLTAGLSYVSHCVIWTYRKVILQHPPQPSQGKG